MIPEALYTEHVKFFAWTREEEGSVGVVGGELVKKNFPFFFSSPQGASELKKDKGRASNLSVTNFFRLEPFGSYWNEDLAKWKDGFRGTND